MSAADSITAKSYTLYQLYTEISKWLSLSFSLVIKVDFYKSNKVMWGYDKQASSHRYGYNYLVPTYLLMVWK